MSLGLTNPAVPGEITQAGMLVCLSNTYGVSYPLTSKPDTSALATGFFQAGVLSELPNIEMGRDTEPVTTGIYGMTQELLFKGLSAKISFSMYGTDAGLLALGLGATPVVTTGAGTVTTAVAIDAASGFTELTCTADPGEVGATVQVCDAAEVAFNTNFAKIRSKSGVGPFVVLLDRRLRQVASAVSSVKPVTAIEIPLSGTAPKYASFAGLVDYPDGRVMLVAFPKVYSAKSLSFGLGNGQDAVKIPIELTAVGVLVGSNPQMGTIKIWP